MVQKAAAVGVRVQGPAERVLDQTRFGPPRRQLPQFLEPQPIGLRRFAGVELKPCNQLFRDAAAATLGENRQFRVYFRSQREIRTTIAVFLNSHVADAYTSDRAAGIVQRLGCRKARKYIDPGLFGCLAEQRGQLSQREDEVAVIPHLRRGRQLEAATPGQVAEFIARRRDEGRRGTRAPIRQQGVQRPGFHHCARQGMRTETRAFLEQADAGVRLELFQPDCGGQPRRAAADDGDLVFHDITLFFVHRANLRYARPLSGFGSPPVKKRSRNRP